MKIIITESQLENVIKKDISEDYPTSWNVEEFKGLRSFAERIRYCENNLKRIASGSSRIVYMIDDTKVLKLAKNKKGLAQNEVEINASNDYLLDGIVARIFEYDENNLWVEMELARKVTPKSFEQITGLNFKEFGDCLHYFELDQTNTRIKPSKPKSYENMWENEFGMLIFDLIGSYGIPSGDMSRISSYGIVSRDEEDNVVLIDYGLTNEVYDSYYS